MSIPFFLNVRDEIDEKYLEPDAIQRYFTRFTTLITDILKGVKGLDRDASLRFFNQIGFDEDTEGREPSGFDEVKYIPKNSSKKKGDLLSNGNRDIFMKEVANTMILTDWSKFFGETLNTTMEMDFYQYYQMKDYVKAVSEIIEEEKRKKLEEEKKKQELEKKQQEGAHGRTRPYTSLKRK